jgi:type I restriction enzyme S subunit
VSSVSSATLEIEETQRVMGRDAPSRARKLIRKGDVLFATIRPTLRRIAVVPESLDGEVCSTGYFVLRASAEVLPRFLYYFLQTECFMSSMESLQKGASYPAVTDGDVRDQLIPLPPLPEQRRIVDLLDRAFEGLAVAAANVEKNLENARELFESHLSEVFTRRGEGWVERRLDEVCQLINGRAYKKHEMLQAGKYPLLRVGNFFSNRDWYYSDLELDADKYCESGDLLYAWSASFGPRIWRGAKTIFHYHIWKVLPRSAVVDKQFLFYLLQWDVDEIKRAHGTGTTMIHVSKGSMEARIVPVPPITAQSRIAATLDSLSAETDRLYQSYEQKQTALASLKRSLLHQAFSGNL